MTVHIPSALFSYTAHATRVDAAGTTVNDVLRELDRRYPGFRFRVIDEQDRVRPHMKVFVGKDPVRDLSRPVAPHDELYILMALSGG